MSAALLVAEHITHRFERLVALKDVSLGLREGEITAIIGPNGAGKSTFLNVLAGIIKPTAGCVRLAGEVVSGLGPHQLPKRGLVKSYQITNIFLSLTCLENVRLAVQARDFRYDFVRRRPTAGAELDEALEILAATGLADKSAEQAAKISHGEQRCLEIAIALAARPKVLLLDEPTAGMSPEETRSMMALIRELGKQRTIALVEHKMKLVFGLCHRVVVLHHGELLADGAPHEIQNDRQVVSVYLGASAC